MLEYDLSEIKDDQLYQLGIARKYAFSDLVEQETAFHAALACKEVESADDPNGVYVLGRGLKKCIGNTNYSFCAKQHTDLIRSNCGAGLAFLINELMIIVDKRGPDEKHTRDIAKIYKSARNFYLDNFSRGISNNRVISRKIKVELPKLFKKRGLIRKAAKMETTPIITQKT